MDIDEPTRKCAVCGFISQKDEFVVVGNSHICTDCYYDIGMMWANENGYTQNESMKNLYE